MNPSRIPLLVVGGGIGGLAAALAVARGGRPVHLLERSSQFGEIGAGLQLAPNASRVLDTLGVLEEIRSFAVFPQNLVWMDMLSGKSLTSVDLGAPFVKRFGYPYMVMHRTDLHDVLLRACRNLAHVTLETSRNVTTYEDHAGFTRVTCRDGSSYEATAVIAADGLWSNGRPVVQNDGDPLFETYVAYRGTLPIEEVSAHAGLDNVVMWTAPERHLVQYPIRRGELFNQVAVFRSHAYTPNSDDWGTPAELDAAFAGTHEIVRKSLERIGRERRWTMADRKPIDGWSHERIALLGDAAHPMLQYVAQGACQALEDAAALGRSAARHDDVADGFAEYQAARVERAARVQRTARFFGELIHIDGTGRTIRDAYLAKRSPNDYETADWLYGNENAAS